jgi:hypothetical protein
MKKIENEVTVNVERQDGSYEKVEIVVRRPTNATISAADRYRAKIWNQCIKDGITTKKQVEVFLKQNNIWGEDQEQEQQKIVTCLAELEKELFGAGKTEKKRKLSEGKIIAEKMAKLRLDLRNLIAEKMSLQDNTAESLADNARFDYIVADCTFYKKNGEKVYSSIEDYNSKSSDEIAYAAAAKLGEMLYAIDADFEKNLPENKWMIDYNLVDDQLRSVKNNELVDREGRRINEFGQYIDENGNRVDRDGNPLEQDGTYKMQVEYEDDINSPSSDESEKKVRKARKTTESNKTE